MAKYEVGIVVKISQSAEVADYKFLVVALDRNAAIKEALVKLKTSVVSEKRATPFLQIIFPKDYKFTITLPINLKFGAKAQYKLEFSISARRMEEAVDKAMQNEELWRRSQEEDEAMFDSVINHMAGIDDGTWPQGIESKMTPEVEKELIAMGNEEKARALSKLSKKSKSFLYLLRIILHTKFIKSLVRNIKGGYH